MQAEKMERLHFEFCKFTGCPETWHVMVLCWAEFFH